MVQNRIVKRAKAARPDLIITVQGGLFPDTVHELKRDGTKVVLWFPDAVVNLGRMLMLLAPYDALFFKDPELVVRLRDMLQLPVHYLPQACNPRWHKPGAREPVARHLVVVGNSYGSRVRQLELLLSAGIPFRIYGPPLPRWAGYKLQRCHTGRYVTRSDKAQIFRQAAGVLNNMHLGEGDGSNLRLFEATASGGAVLSEYRPSTKYLYRLDAEVLVFQDLEELISKARLLLADPDLGTRIGDAASVRALAEHTYSHRLAKLLTVVA